MVNGVRTLLKPGLTKSECNDPDQSFEENESEGTDKSEVLTPSMSPSTYSCEVRGKDAYQKRRPTRGTRAISPRAYNHEVA